MKRLPLSIVALCLLAGAFLFLGCSEDVFIGARSENQPPEVWLSSGPVEGDTTGYQVHFYWSGWDPDGEIACFEFVIVDGDPFGFNPADTMGLDKWRSTMVHDSVFRVLANDSTREYDDGNRIYTRYDKTHTFFLRAVDLRGKRSRAATRSFTAWTLAPVISIDRPPLQSSSIQAYSKLITFGWTGKDPVDDPTNVQDPDSIRYLVWRIPDTLSVWVIDHLNNNVMEFEDIWSPWISYRAPGDSGRVTIIGDDEILEAKRYIFALQAKDDAGAVTAIFNMNENVRVFYVSDRVNPILLITEPMLGGFKFVGTKLNPEERDLPPGIPLHFCWIANVADYGGEVVGYRYGWDVKDLGNDDEWPVPFSPFTLCAPEKKLYSGIHDFYAEVLDNGGRITRAHVQITVVRFSMERNLLWVDDFYAIEMQHPLYMTPSEQNHDMFWLDICGRAVGFEPTRDVYDCQAKNIKPPKLEYLGKYKNVIWTYSSSMDVWGNVVRFTPESMIGQGTQVALNFLSVFLVKGGHLWTLGRSDQMGGMSKTFIEPPLFPVNLRFEMNPNDDEDTSGVRSMGYKDYCITVIDKISGLFRINRTMNFHDVMVEGYRDDTDSLTNLFSDQLPESLYLWEEVSKEGRFFYSGTPPGGFTYAEIYDPEYWILETGTQPQKCFHPIFRMKARNALSPIDDGTIAIWVTNYEDVVPEVDSGIALAAPSFHFGFPLWFFNRSQVDQIVDFVFTQWQINAEE